MSLEIGIGDGRSVWSIEKTPSLALEDDGYYWFLHPLLVALADETGQYVDLYGEARFQGESLNALERVLVSACELVESQPSSWEVHVGTQLSPERRELYKPVERRRFLELIATWQGIVARARELRRAVLCFGD
jgi:hypothetical protein